MKGLGWMAGVVLGLAVTGCGGGGSIPSGPNAQGGDAGDPVIPGEGQAEDSLWPLTTGSRWVYRITDPAVPVFEKRVEVIGVEGVPGTTVDAVHVKSVQPHLEEHSWQALTVDGLVVRLREEDLKEGAVVRTTTWDPANIKSIDTMVDASWTHSSVVQESTVFSDGSTENKERTYVWRVLGTNVHVETPAGSFDNAIQLERTRPDKEDWVRTYWLVPGVGKVREEGERTEELLEYEVK